MLDAKSIDLSISEVKKELNIWCGGFSIYRDGFRIGQTGGMDDDWLEWDNKSLKAQGCWRAFKIDQVCALNFDQANLGCRLLHRCG